MSKPSTSRPSLEASVYNSIKDAFMRRSPTKNASTSTATATATATAKAPTTKKSPFAIFTSRHKQSASTPAAVPIPSTQSQSLSAARSSKVSSLPTQPPPVPPKSAPASRTTSPIAPVAQKIRPIALVPLPPPRSSERPRPTVPFASSSLHQPTAASSARTRPTVTPTTTSSSSVTRPTISSSSHKRVLSKSRIEPVIPTSPSTASDSKTSSSRTATATATSTINEVKPKPPSPDVKISGPMGLRPRTPTNRLPTSPPSAFPMRQSPVRSLPRKRSKTFPDPSDPVAPVPPSTLSRSMNTANRILEAFEPSPLMNDSPETAQQQQQQQRQTTSPTPPPKSPARAGSTSPVKPIRSPQDPFMSIPSRARSPGSNRIMPTATLMDSTASRQRQPLKVQTVRSPVANSPAGRASFDQSLPPPPRKPLSPTTATSANPTQPRKLARPPLRPIQTKPVSEPNVIAINKSPSPETPDTQPSSPSPKTPVAPYAETNYLTSDDEGSRKKRGLRSLFNRKRPDSLVSSSSYLSASGTSNASATLSGVPSRPHLRQKGPGTFGGLPEEDEVPTLNTQMRHGIKRHAHPPAEVPYPVSFEEMVLQGEKHTQELLSMVLNQKTYHFTPLDNFSKVKNVLDLGCGRGYWITNAVKDWKNAKFIGFDLVDVFLTPQEMRDKRGLQDSQVSRIEFVKGNFFNTLPFPSDHFDFIRLAFLELAVPESKWSALLKEAWRVLRPGGHIEVVIETYLFPTVWSYEKLEIQQSLEDEFRRMLDARDIPPPTNIGEKMFFDPFVRVQTHQHVSVCIAPRPAGRSSLDDPTSPRNFGSMRSMHSPWSSEPMVMVDRGVVSPTPFGSRPSLDRSWTSVDVLPPPGQIVTSRTCAIPGIVIYPDTFVPVSEETLFTYASHGAMILNATRLAAFSDKYPDASLNDYESEWRHHVEQYWQYERSNRLRLGFRMKQFDDDDEDDEVPAAGPTAGRWKWSKCDEDLERPLEIRRFRAWTLTKPGSTR